MSFVGVTRQCSGEKIISVHIKDHDALPLLETLIETLGKFC